MRKETPDTGLGWEGPGRAQRRRFRWSDLLWNLIFPARSHRILPTVPGLVLIGLALGIGTAAYNTASNILFLTLSLLLACLILSGVMSWLNIRGLCWRLLLSPPLRAGQETPVILELWNRKTLLPTYGLWFELSARHAPHGPQRAETTLRASSAEIKAVLARAGQGASRITLPLRARLDPGAQTRLEWLFSPARRGLARVELTRVGSLFPFGFLRKSHGVRLRREVIVWPAPVEYRFLRTAAAIRLTGGEHVTRPGAGNDLLALRRYQTGDSHRLVHWKASARLRQLMVRQFAAESLDGFFLWVETSSSVWTHEEQFELLCQLAATLAEDLFTAGRLTGAAIDEEEHLLVRRVRDLESFLDRLALLEFPTQEPKSPVPNAQAQSFEPSTLNSELNTQKPDFTRPGAGRRRPGHNLITFAPEGARGVAAYVDGEKTATA